MSHDAAKVLPKLNVCTNLLLHAQIYWVVATFESGRACCGQIWFHWKSQFSSDLKLLRFGDFCGTYSCDEKGAKSCGWFDNAFLMPLHSNSLIHMEILLNWLNLHIHLLHVLLYIAELWTLKMKKTRTPRHVGCGFTNANCCLLLLLLH